MQKAHLFKKPLELHREKNWFRNIILGGQDGLVNVLGIVLGISAATTDNKILIAASVAAGFAEAVSMAAVAYTSTMAEKDFYEKEQEREAVEIEEAPQREKKEIRKIYETKGFSGDILETIVSTITANKKVWLNTMMEEELNLSPIETKTVVRSSIIVGIAALMASFIPVFPFIFLSHDNATLTALLLSGLILFLTGVYEAKTYVGNWWKNGLQMLLIGLGAAIVGFLIGNIFRVK